MHLQTICLLILLGVLSITNETFSQNPVVNTEEESSSIVSKNSQNLQKRPRSDVHRPARQQRPQSGFGGLLSGKYSIIKFIRLVLTQNRNMKKLR